jgi:hypothetical protein
MNLMNIDSKQAFLLALRDLMVEHSVTSIYGYSDGQIEVSSTTGFMLCDLGTIEEIEEEIKNLK